MQVSMNMQKIGWIGVGNMGRAMCMNLLRAGYSLVVYDKDLSKLEAVAGAGALAVASPAAVAAQTDAVFSTIWDDAALLDIVIGKDGIIQGGRDGQPYVDMSTVSPHTSRTVAQKLQDHGLQYLRAPVSGTVSVAQAGKLTIFASGSRDTFDACLHLFQAISSRQTYVGTGEDARIVKLMINLLLLMNTATLGEALSFGERAGLSRDIMVKAINDSVVGSMHYAGKADALIRRDLTPAGSIALVAKDMQLAMDVAHEGKTALPISSLVQQYLYLLSERGHANSDVIALAMLLDQLNGLDESQHNK